MRKSKCEITRLDSYPYRVELRPSDPNVAMNMHIVPWLNENVNWDGNWTLEADGKVSPDSIYFRFRVASLDDAMLVKLRWQ